MPAPSVRWNDGHSNHHFSAHQKTTVVSFPRGSDLDRAITVGLYR